MDKNKTIKNNAVRNKAIKKMAKETKKKINGFDLEHSVAGGHLSIGREDYIRLDDLAILSKGNYLIHIEYSEKDKTCYFTAYREKK